MTWTLFGSETKKKRGSRRTSRNGRSISSAGHMLSNIVVPGLPMGVGVRVKYGVHPGARDAPGTPCAHPITTSFPFFPPHWSRILSADFGATEAPQRTSEEPLSILELQSVDEKSKSAVTKLGLLPSTVLTAQSRGKKEEVGDYLGANTGSADCLRLLRTGGLHNRKHPQLRKSFLQLFSVLFPKTYSMLPCVSKLELLSWLWL